MSARNIRIGAEENVRIRVDRLEGYVLQVRIYLHAKGLEASGWYAIETGGFDSFVADLRALRDGGLGPVSVQSLASDFTLSVIVSSRGLLACEVKMKRSEVYPEKLKSEGWSVAATFGAYPAAITIHESAPKYTEKTPNQPAEPTRRSETPRATEPESK
jgi:hypothetical protein